MAQVVNAYIDIADWILGSFNGTRTVGLGDAYRVQYRGWTTVRVDYIPSTLSLCVNRNWHQWDSTVQYRTDSSVLCGIEVPIITLKKSLILSLGKRSGSTQPLRDEDVFNYLSVSENMFYSSEIKTFSSACTQSAHTYPIRGLFIFL